MVPKKHVMLGQVKADFLEWMDHYVRAIRVRFSGRGRPGLQRPFGGIQLVFIGDFAQLGPVDIGPSLTQPPLKPTDKGAPPPRAEKTKQTHTMGGRTYTRLSFRKSQSCITRWL